MLIFALFCALIPYSTTWNKPKNVYFACFGDFCCYFFSTIYPIYIHPIKSSYLSFAVFPSPSLPLSSPLLCFVNIFSLSFSSFLCSFASPVWFALSSSTDKKNKAKQTKFAPLYFYLLLSLRPEPSNMLIIQTISISSTRINTKSQPISNQPRKATKNKIRIMLPAFVEKL